MHPRAILAIARKDALEILLNKSMLTVLLMPILMALLFLFVGRLVSGHIYNILVYNPGQSRIVQLFEGSFDHVHFTPASSPEAVTAAFGPDGASKDAAYDVGLIVPADYESALRAGGHSQVQLYLNGTNITAQNSALLQAAVVNYSRQVASPQPPVTLTTSMINPSSNPHFEDLVGTFYGAVTLLCSFMVGSSVMPGLLIEEKERKTLRMLMVTPASFSDVILGKLLVVLVYQLALSLLSLAIVNGFTGQIGLILGYTLLGSGLSLGLGLLLGGLFNSAATAGAVGGMLTLIYILPAMFSGPLGSLFGNNPIVQAMKAFPTYYIADGVYLAMEGQATFANQILDLGVPLAVIIVLLAITAWLLRRQSAVAGTI